ncbi:MAG TPA: hypothetical protein VFQ87_09325 [Bradyrhizobium sp.]|nr:hypothetical protein [Bradyrhizobium sp.]
MSSPAPILPDFGVPQGNGWISAMRAGEFERVWSITDRDLARCAGPGDKHKGPRHLQRIWRGEELGDRTVLVRCYHGLGDTIQFARFLPALAERARRLIVWCQPELLPLVERVEGVDQALPLHNGTVEAAFDVDIEIMEIPHAIRAGRDLIECRKPYLAAPRGAPPRRITARQGLSAGLVWEVGDWDKRRAVPPALLNRLKQDGVELYALQRGAAPEDLAATGAIDISTPDIGTLCHRLGELDLILSVDTMVVHLAGALGYRPWVLLHADCDWRWPAPGGVSHWYPGATLFHQRIAGDWAGVMDDVREALRRRLD